MVIDIGTIAKQVGGHGASATLPLLVMFMYFTPVSAFNAEVARSERSFILDTADKAMQAPAGDYKRLLCRTLEQSIARLCAAAPTDSLCVDRMEILKRAGCQ